LVIWLTGLSGAGKTTLGRALHRLWREHAPNTVLLDGDEVRRVFGDDAGPEPYTVPGRRRNAERMAALCALLDGQEINVVCCILSIFSDLRATNRSRYSRYFEVYLQAPLEVLAARDGKNLYAPALRGETRNVVGVDIPFEPPADSDLVIDTTSPPADMDTLARSILEAARKA
jgi:cytidine diphosphoramidate kinase